jgi:hypothetical protein
MKKAIASVHIVTVYHLSLNTDGKQPINVTSCTYATIP